MLPGEYPPGPSWNHFPDSPTLSKASAIEVHNRLILFSRQSQPAYVLTGNLIYLWVFMLALSGIKVARHLKEPSSLQLLLLSFGRVTGTDLFIKIAKAGRDSRVFQQPGLGEPGS